MNQPEFLIIHHTGGTDADPLADSSGFTFQQCDELHRVKFGLRSSTGNYIGYHYYIERDGTVFQGRADNDEGAHTIKYNKRSIGICLAGNFDLTLPTPPQIASLKALLEAKMALYGVPASKVVPHRLFAQKTCYGRKLSDDWARSLVVVVPKEDEKLKLTLQIKILQLKLAIMRLLGNN